MKLFGRWRKNGDNDIDISVSELQAKSGRRHSKPTTGQQKSSLFDNIVGYEDAKELYEIKCRKTGTSASGRTASISQIVVYELAY